ncbi:transcriptional regulator ATRX-like [Pocillopora damicornis]|nr:transcriptional regulator ATRX-like [Pocillopora damicornis]
MLTFMTATCEKLPSGKAKLVSVVPHLICDIIAKEKKSIGLSIEAVKLTNIILGDEANHDLDPSDAVCLASKELEDNMEFLLVSAGDFELQAGMVELIVRLLPCASRFTKAPQYFIDKFVSQAFREISMEDFEAGCRHFLNTLNESQKEKRSVTSIPCYSAHFGTLQVYQPSYEKIKDFWIDFNYGSESITLFVEERDRSGNYKEGSSWETVLIKAGDVEDYRIKDLETKKDEVALLLKLKHAASELVSFGPQFDNQFVKFSFSGIFTNLLTSVLKKIMGSPKFPPSSDSDVSLTPSTKASVAMNPVCIKSTQVEVTCVWPVMPTATLMSQEQRRSDSSTDIDMSKKNFLEKSLPTAFNVSKRLKASKKKEESLSNGAKTYQGIREKVFSTRHSYPLVESQKKIIGTLPMVTPARRRDPRSGKRRIRSCTLVQVKGYRSRKAENTKLSFSSSSNVFSESDISSNQGLKKDRPARSKVLVPDPAKKHQRISDVVYDENRIDMGKYKTGNDIPKNQGANEDATSRRRSQSTKVQKKQATSHVFALKSTKDADDEDDYLQENQYETVLDDYELESSDYTTEYYQEAEYGTSSPVVKVDNASQRHKSLEEDLLISPHDMDDYARFDHQNTRKPVTKKFKIAKDRIEILKKKNSRVCIDFVFLPTPKSREGSGDNCKGEESQRSPMNLSKITPIGEASEASDVTEQDEDKEKDVEVKADSANSDIEIDYNFDINMTPIYRRKYRNEQRLAGNNTQLSSSEGRLGLKRVVSRDDSGIGETPFQGKHTKVSKKKSLRQRPLQVSVVKTPITPRSELDKDNCADVESGKESASSQESGKEIMVRKRKRNYFEWSRSGPSYPGGASLTAKSTEHREGWYSRSFYRPRKLSYEENREEPDEEEDDGEEEEEEEEEEETRKEVQGLINFAGRKIMKAVRRKRLMIRSFVKKSNEVMFTTIDSLWSQTQAASYDKLRSCKNQFSEQVQVLEKEIDKTSAVVRGIEETFNGLEKQFKILKNQRQVENKRFKGLEHLQVVMESELTKLKRKREEREIAVRTEMENEMEKLQNKFLQDARKQTEDYLKMTLNTLRIL